MPAEAAGLLPVGLWRFFILRPPAFLPPLLLPLPGLPKLKPAACRDAAASGVSDGAAAAGAVPAAACGRGELAAAAAAFSAVGWSGIA
jgi:hypothetical protein